MKVKEWIKKNWPYIVIVTEGVGLLGLSILCNQAHQTVTVTNATPDSVRILACGERGFMVTDEAHFKELYDVLRPMVADIPNSTIIQGS